MNVKNTLPILLSAGVLTIQVQAQQKKTSRHIVTMLVPSSQNTLLPHFTTTILSAKQKLCIKRVLASYGHLYGLSQMSIQVKEENMTDDLGRQTLAHAEPNGIYLNPLALKGVSDEVLENVIWHELLHTIKPKAYSPSFEKHILSDGFHIDGFHGMSIMVTRDTVHTKFGVIEDAAAEACAALAHPSYSIQNPSYAHIGSYMLKMIHQGRISANDLIEIQKTNDMYRFASEILAKPANIKDIEYLMALFNTVYTADQDLSDWAVAQIYQRRLAQKK